MAVDREPGCLFWDVKLTNSGGLSEGRARPHASGRGGFRRGRAREGRVCPAPPEPRGADEPARQEAGCRRYPRVPGRTGHIFKNLIKA